MTDSEVNEKDLVDIRDNLSDYSLVGQINQVEGASPEASTPGARLRGFLAPDGESIYKPEATSPATKPSSLLLEEVLRAPGTEAWPDEKSPGVQAAMSWIGNQTILDLGELGRQLVG